MALGSSPLNTKVEGGEIMTDFEIISVVIMVASLVLKAIKFGRDDNDKKKKWLYNKSRGVGKKDRQSKSDQVK